VGGDTGGEVGASEEKNGHRVDAADAEARRLGGLGVGLEAPPEALPEVTAPSGDNSDAARGGVTITAAPGDVVAFSSRLWHASGPNRSGQVRRVFYAQFSSRPLTDGSKDPSPISLAVPCG